MTKVYLGATGLAFMLMASFFALQNTSQNPARSFTANNPNPRVAGAEVQMAVSNTGTLPPASYSLTVVKTGTGSGAITSVPTGINCGTGCGGTFTAGTSITLTATPAAGSTIAAWQGCSNIVSAAAVGGILVTNNTCTVNLNATTTVLVSFTAAVPCLECVTAPSVSTAPAALVTSTSAVLMGNVNANGSTTTSWFRYSATAPVACSDSFGIRVGGADTGSGTNVVQVQQPLSGLSASTSYYYCAIASNAAGIRYGAVVQFATSASVAASNLNISLASSPTDSTIAKGAADYTATAFNFTAGAGSSITVTSLAVTVGTSDTNDNSYAYDGSDGVAVSNFILSAKLMDGDTQVGPLRSSLGGVLTFAGLNWSIPAATTKRLAVVVTTNSAAELTSGSDDYMRFSFEAGGVGAVEPTGAPVTAVGLPVNSSETVSDVVVDITNAQQAGDLTASFAPTPINPSSGLQAAGSTDRSVAAYKFTAVGEPYYVKKFTLVPYVKGVPSTASNDRIATLKVRYPIQSGGTRMQVVALSGGSNLVDISAMPMYVPPGGSSYLEVLADWANFTLLDGTEDEQIAFGLDAGNSFGANLAVGAMSNATDTQWGLNGVVGNSQEVLRTVLSVAAGSGAPNNTTRTRSAAQKVASLVFSAGSSSDAFFRFSPADTITAHVSGNLNLGAVSFNLKDSGGTVRAAGTHTITSGEVAAGKFDVVLAPVGDIEVSSSPLQLDLETNTITLVGGSASSLAVLDVSVDTGAVSSAGGFQWYDNSDSAGGNNVAAITVVNPTSTNISFVNTYEGGGGVTSYTLSVAKLGDGLGGVTSSPPGIDCGGACSASYLSGTPVTLTATPASGYAFSSWGGDCGGSNPVCVVSVTRNTSVTATFASSTGLQPGDLISMTGNPTVYYLGTDNKRYVFPQNNDATYAQKVFASWGLSENQIKVIPASLLQSLAIGGNVTVRPGTWLLQLNTDSGTSNVYAVTYGHVLHLVPSDLLTVLYGSDWQKRLIKVPDAFFVNYNMGSPVLSGVLPDGTVVTLTESPYGHYLIYGGKKKFISQDTWIAERLGGHQINETNLDDTSYGFGTDLVGTVPCLGDVAQLTTCDFSGLGTMQVKAVAISPTSAIVTWHTNLPSTSGAQHSLDLQHITNVSGDTDMATTHSATITGLASNSWYNYRVYSALSGGAPVYSDWAVFQTGGLASSFKILTPNGGESWLLGNTYTIGWTTAGIPSAYANASIRLELVNPDGTKAADWPATGSVFAGDDSRFGRASWSIPVDSTLAGSTYKVRIGLYALNQPPLYGVGQGVVFFSRSLPPPSCSAVPVTVSEKPLGNSTFGNLGLDISTHPEILKYRIQWFSGGWSNWFTPGADDVDWKTNPDGTLRRVWAYFGDHTHEYQKCGAGSTLPDFVVTDIKVEQRVGDTAPYIYTTVKNIGGGLVNNSILSVAIKDLDTNQMYYGGITDAYVTGWAKDMSSANPIIKNISGIYHLQATADKTGDGTGIITESNEDNNSLTKVVVVGGSLGHQRGSLSASVTLEQWVDHQDPFGVRFEPTISSILSNYSGKVNLVVKPFPLGFHPLAEKAAEAGECAAAQNEFYFWKFHDWFMAQANSWTIDSIKAYANQLGLSAGIVSFDAPAFAKCLDGGEKASVVQRYLNEGQGKGISGIPTTFVIRNSTQVGQKVEGAVPYDTLKAVIDRVLGASGSTPVGSPVPSLSEIATDAQAVTNGDTASLSTATDAEQVSLQQRAQAIISKIAALQAELATITPQLKDFIALGTPTTQKLGQGERAGVVSSFTSAFGKAPSTEDDWSDLIKIGVGHFPTQRSATKEQQAEVAFQKIYLRPANRATNAHDDAAVMVEAYGIRPTDRNLGSEAAAIKSFKAIYGHTPSSATDWDTVRAIAYSGATRQVPKAAQ